MSSPASVVCNSGPLITLAKLNLLHLLNELYGRVYFSRSVYNEAVVEGMRQGYEDAGTLFMFLNQMGWLPEKVELGDTSAESRDARLDQGERDTLALAIAKGSTLILMDEAEGRRVARAGLESAWLPGYSDRSFPPRSD